MNKYYIETADQMQFSVEQVVDHPPMKWILSNDGRLFEIGKSDYGVWYNIGPIITTSSIDKPQLEFDILEVGKLIDELPLTLDIIKKKLLNIGMTYFSHTEIEDGKDDDSWVVRIKGQLRRTNSNPTVKIFIEFDDVNINEWYENGFTQKNVTEHIYREIQPFENKEGFVN